MQSKALVFLKKDLQSLEDPLDHAQFGQRSLPDENSYRVYRKSSIKPPRGAYFFQALLRGGLIERGAYLI